MDAMLASETGRRLVALSGDPRLDGELVNDAYKPRMHKLYAMLMPAVQVCTLRRITHMITHGHVACFTHRLYPGWMSCSCWRQAHALGRRIFADNGRASKACRCAVQSKCKLCRLCSLAWMICNHRRSPSDTTGGVCAQRAQDALSVGEDA